MYSPPDLTFLTISEPHEVSIIVSELHNHLQSTDFDAVKLYDGSSGFYKRR